MRLIHGDCLEKLASLEDCSVHAVVTDPPAGIGFMGKAWDGAKGGREKWIGWLSAVLVECRRVLKPGGHALIWALPRTSHWTGEAIERAGFEVRDVVTHLFGSGFPKSLDVGKAIDAAAGAEREVVGAPYPVPNAAVVNPHFVGIADTRDDGPRSVDYHITAPTTDLAKQWDGWGTSLKPAAEFWFLARRPLSGTVAANVAEFGTGGINVDGCRVGCSDKAKFPAGIVSDTEQVFGGGKGMHEGRPRGDDMNPTGRWPANLALSCCDTGCPDCPRKGIDAQSGETQGQARVGFPGGHTFGGSEMKAETGTWFGDTGGASRFFYIAKPSRAEREFGCELLPPKTPGEMTDRKDGSAAMDSPRTGAGRTSGARNTHPTLKSIALMRWLCRLITPPGGTVLDPFMGSGTTGMACAAEGFEFIGIEKEAEYIRIAKARIEWASSHPAEMESDEDLDTAPQVGQMGLFV